MRREPRSHWALVDSPAGQIKIAKVIHVTEAEAADEAGRLSRVSRWSYEHYTCSLCGHWHTGQSRPVGQDIAAMASRVSL